MKLRCWPGCRAEIIDGHNKGAIIVVTERAPDWLGYAIWHAISLSGPLLVYGGHRRTIVGEVADRHLRPLPDIDTLTPEDRVEEIAA